MPPSKDLAIFSLKNHKYFIHFLLDNSSKPRYDSAVNALDGRFLKSDEVCARKRTARTSSQRNAGFRGIWSLTYIRMANMTEAVKTYFKDAKSELGKVNWPSRQDTTRLSLLVVGASLIIAAFFGILDFGLSGVLDKIIQFSTR